MTETTAITDWLAAIDGHKPRWPRTDQKRRQLGIALAYLVDRVQAGTVEEPDKDKGRPGTRGHAARILIADSDAPRAERNFGIRARAHDKTCADAMAELENDGCECWCHVPVVEPTAVVAPKAKGPAKAKVAAEEAEES